MDEEQLKQVKYDTFDDYINNHINDIYNLEIDGILFNIPFKTMVDIFTLVSTSFKDLMETTPETIENIKTPYLFYAILEYFKDNNLTHLYNIPENIKEIINSIRSCEYVDILAINDYLSNDVSFLEDIKVNDDLVSSILNGMDSSFNRLEQAIYIYIKMCRLLTYDPEFYAVNQKRPASLKHEDISNIENISLTNNKVVCYEFNAIYAYILNMIGINYKNYITINDGEFSTEDEFDPEVDEYSQGHTFLKFRCDKFIVKADAVTSIILGDMTRAKLNEHLEGLVLENKNISTKVEYRKSFNKVYNYIYQNEMRISTNNIGETESFEDIVNEFRESSDRFKPISIEERIKILIEKVNSTKMIGLDAFSYLLQLRKILFTNFELKDNFTVNIIRESNEESADSIAILYVSIPDSNGNKSMEYYIYRPGNKLERILKREIEARFDNNNFGYINTVVPAIPGISR